MAKGLVIYRERLCNLYIGEGLLIYRESLYESPPLHDLGTRETLTDLQIYKGVLFIKVQAFLIYDYGFSCRVKWWFQILQKRYKQIRSDNRSDYTKNRKIGQGIQLNRVDPAPLDQIGQVKVKHWVSELQTLKYEYINIE